MVHNETHLLTFNDMPFSLSLALSLSLCVFVCVCERKRDRETKRYGEIKHKAYRIKVSCSISKVSCSMHTLQCLSSGFLDEYCYAQKVNAKMKPIKPE